MKLCKDCIHFLKGRAGKEFPDYCIRPIEVNHVYGGYYRASDWPKDARSIAGACGPEGRYYAERQEEVKHPWYSRLFK